MNKLDPGLSAMTIPSISRPDSPSGRRFIVLIPDAELDYAFMVHRVWELTDGHACGVLFLGMCRDVSRESGLRRQIATMCAMIQSGKVQAGTRVEIGTNWAEAIKSDLQKNDMIVCPVTLRAGLFQRPLNQVLESNLSAPVYVLSGTGDYLRPSPGRLSQFLVWAGSGAILAGSGLLQFRIASMPADWVQTTLLVLSVAAEVWLIWIWNSLFG